jgi:hypothetical protein
MKKLILIPIIILSLLIPSICLANGAITGTVTYRGEAIDSVTVAIQHQCDNDRRGHCRGGCRGRCDALTTLTNENGEFVFRNIPAGEYVLVAYKGRFEGRAIVEVIDDEISNADIVLRPVRMIRQRHDCRRPGRG